MTTKCSFNMKENGCLPQSLSSLPTRRMLQSLHLATIALIATPSTTNHGTTTTNVGASTTAPINNLSGGPKTPTPPLMLFGVNYATSLVMHVAMVCRSRSHNHCEAKANYVTGFQTTTNPWIVDSGASHHITTEPHNMQEYNGMEEVAMGDGNKILITHTGLTQLHASNNAFKLSHTLCAPAIKRNLIFVSKFCQDNLTSIEFFPFHFFVKDL